MTKKFIYLGFIEDWLVGMIAATLLVLSSNPESSLHLIILSIISGYGGEAVLRSFDFVRDQRSQDADSSRHNRSPHE